MPNALAYLALLIWPLVVVVLFRRLPPVTALIWSVLGGYLLLPPMTEIDLPVLPPMDKFSIPVLSSYFAAWSVMGRRVKILPRDWPGRLLALVYVLWPIVAVLANPEPIERVQVGPIQGLVLYDAISLMVQPFLALMLLALARELFDFDARAQLVRAFMFAGLAYSIPMLAEVVLSPQLNTWIYGFFPHDFIQMMRQGGFRPVVFLDHGLWVAFFTVTALVSAAACTRTLRADLTMRCLLATAWLMLVLVLSKSLGSLLYGLVLVPVIWFLPARLILRGSVLIGLLVLCYPLLRASPLFPDDWMLAQAAKVSADRAQSLQFRLENEAVLLARAMEKPWTGWASFGRNLLYSPWDGRAITITDGRWIIALGNYGWPGFFAEFGLLFLVLARHGLRPSPQVGIETAALVAILAINLVDMVPNATLTPLTWLIAGALCNQKRAEGGISLQDPFAPKARTLI